MLIRDRNEYETVRGSRTRGPMPVCRGSNAWHRVQRHPPPPHFDTEPDDRSHHLMTERVGSYGELDDLPRAPPPHPEHVPGRRLPFALPTERYEVVHADERLHCPVHGIDVKLRRERPRRDGREWVVHCRVSDPIPVRPTCRREPRVKSGRHFSEASGGDLRSELTVERSQDSCGVELVARKRHDLPRCMHTSVCATRDESVRGASVWGKSRFELPLHGAYIGLYRVPVEPRTVVCQIEPVGDHG